MEIEALMQKSISHLFESADVLKQSDKTNVLRSYYSIECQRLRKKGNCNLPSYLSKSSNTCSRCCISYSNQKTFNRILPSKGKSRFLRRLKKKIQINNNLTPFQQRIANKLIKNNEVENHNILVTVCGICRKKHKTIIQKPSPPQPKEILSDKKRKKKKKKNDGLAGLNPEYVLSSSKTNLSFKQQKGNTIHNNMNPKKGPSSLQIKQLLIQSKDSVQSPSLKDFFK